MTTEKSKRDDSELYDNLGKKLLEIELREHTDVSILITVSSRPYFVGHALFTAESTSNKILNLLDQIKTSPKLQNCPVTIKLHAKFPQDNATVSRIKKILAGEWDKKRLFDLKWQNLSKDVIPTLTAEVASKLTVSLDENDAVIVRTSSFPVGKANTPDTGNTAVQGQFWATLSKYVPHILTSSTTTSSPSAPKKTA